MAKPAWIYLVGAARKIWQWSPERRQVKKNACLTSSTMRMEKYRCAKCEKAVKKIQIDHIIPVGKAPRDFHGWDDYYKKLFCSTYNLQALCLKCHKLKSKE